MYIYTPNSHVTPRSEDPVYGPVRCANTQENHMFYFLFCFLRCPSIHRHNSITSHRQQGMYVVYMLTVYACATNCHHNVSFRAHVYLLTLQNSIVHHLNRQCLRSTGNRSVQANNHLGSWNHQRTCSKCLLSLYFNIYRWSLIVVTFCVFVLVFFWLIFFCL